MHLTVTTQPSPLVELEEAKLALGYDHTNDRDTQIEGLILAAQAELDGPTGWVGITVAEQGVEIRMDAFSDCGKGILLPYGPVTGITEITYLDEEDAEQTLDDTNYALTTDGRVILTTDGEWPDISSLSEAARIAYEIGITDADDPRVHLMKSAIILHVKMTLDLEDVETIRKTIRWLTAPLRVWGS